MSDLKERKQSVDIRTLGINSNGYPEQKEEVDYDLRTCNKCKAEFRENKYGIWYICESCFEKKHNEQEMSIFNELTPIFLNPNECHVQKPDNHLTGIEQVDYNLFILDIDEDGCFDFIYEGTWKKKVEEKYKVLYEFSASDGIGNSILEWLIKT
jgi:hypothetical protein